MNLPKIQINRATKVKISVTALLAMLFGVFCLLVALWSNHNKVTTHKPVLITVKFQKPITIEPREPLKVVEYVGEIELNQMVEKSPNPPIAEYICEKFGPVQCPTALAVAKAESGMSADRYNFNNNGTLDYGVFQINSVHWSREGCSMEDLVDPYKNVDCAHKLWKEQGWQIWAVVNNGSYLAHLE